MRFEASFKEVKMYTEKLLEIKDFKNKQEKINYQEKLSNVRDRLMGVRHEVQWLGCNAEVYFMEDLENMIEKMDVFTLINEVNSRLTALSHSQRLR